MGGIGGRGVVRVVRGGGGAGRAAWGMGGGGSGCLGIGRGSGGVGDVAAWGRGRWGSLGRWDGSNVRAVAPAPVLLVHGVRTSHTMWRAQVEALEQLGHRVLAIDLPGHGTRIEERFTLEAANEAVHAGVRELAGIEVGDGSPGAADIEVQVRPPGAARARVANGSAGAGVVVRPVPVVVVGLSLGAYVALH